jgi:hypothetical protein
MAFSSDPGVFADIVESGLGKLLRRHIFLSRRRRGFELIGSTGCFQVRALNARSGAATASGCSCGRWAPAATFNLSSTFLPPSFGEAVFALPGLRRPRSAVAMG